MEEKEKKTRKGAKITLREPRLRVTNEYKHRSVNHTKSFVDPKSELIKVWKRKINIPVHTQNVERYNKEIKRFLRKKYDVA